VRRTTKYIKNLLRQIFNPDKLNSLRIILIIDLILEKIIFFQGSNLRNQMIIKVSLPLTISKKLRHQVLISALYLEDLKILYLKEMKVIIQIKISMKTKNKYIRLLTRTNHLVILHTIASIIWTS